MSLSKKDLRHISEAMRMANYSTMLNRHGCVVAKNSKKISSGFNSLRNRFKNIRKHFCSSHAEFSALYKLDNVWGFKSIRNSHRPKWKLDKFEALS